MNKWKFYSNTLLSFENINIFIFLLNGLELPNHATFLKVLGNLAPEMWSAIMQTAKRCMISHNLSPSASKSAGRVSSLGKSGEKNKKEALYFSYLARQSLTTDLYKC